MYAPELFPVADVAGRSAGLAGGSTRGRALASGEWRASSVPIAHPCACWPGVSSSSHHTCIPALLARDPVSPLTETLLQRPREKWMSLVWASLLQLFNGPTKCLPCRHHPLNNSRDTGIHPAILKRSSRDAKHTVSVRETDEF